MKLWIVLALLAAFAGGMHFDRWLHRPIVIHNVSTQGIIGPPHADKACGLSWNICWQTT